MNTHDPRTHIAISADAVPIHYDVYGTGLPALVFVHGWLCDRSYWESQVQHFAQQYQVVTIDLAGHGASGHDRNQWTVPAFGQDIVAVVEQMGLQQVVLIGHSMGARWIVEAARRLPASVIGLVGLDNWVNVARILTPEKVAEKLAPFRSNFEEAVLRQAPSWFTPAADPNLVTRVVSATSAAPAYIAISAAEESWGSDRILQEGLREVHIQKIAINARPMEAEAAQLYGIEVAMMSNVGHFMMMEDPQTFNRLLDEAVRKCLHRREHRKASSPMVGRFSGLADDAI